MMHLARRRREAERQRKLEVAFNAADVKGEGRLTVEQVVKIFASEDVTVSNLEEELTKLAGKDGWIKLQEFMRFSYGTELCKVEFVDHVFSKKGAGDDAEEAKARAAEAAKKKEMSKSKSGEKLDKIELAFRKFDKNQDGFLSKEEFDVMMKDVPADQAERIFRSCDQRRDGRVSLAEFRSTIQRGKEKLKS